MSETAATDNELLGDIEEAMRDVVDPELGINVVDLGLVYGLNLEEAEEGTVALIDMTLTSPACPLTDVIEDQSRSALINCAPSVSPFKSSESTSDRLCGVAVVPGLTTIRV
jgi:metal-sulfur cluster biosynthetic enzyme